MHQLLRQSFDACTVINMHNSRFHFTCFQLFLGRRCFCIGGLFQLRCRLSAALCVVAKRCKIVLWCVWRSIRNVGLTFRLVPFRSPQSTLNPQALYQIEVAYFDTGILAKRQIEHNFVLRSIGKLRVSFQFVPLPTPNSPLTLTTSCTQIQH